MKDSLLDLTLQPRIRWQTLSSLLRSKRDEAVHHAYQFIRPKAVSMADNP